MKLRRLLVALNHYIVFFLLVAFITTCCMSLFVTTMSRTLNITLTDEVLSDAARLTFNNVVLLSVIFTVMDYLRRKFTVCLPVKRITEAAEKWFGEISASALILSADLWQRIALMKS